jgi:hypothetical protein
VSTHDTPGFQSPVVVAWLKVGLGSIPALNRISVRPRRRVQKRREGSNPFFRTLHEIILGCTSLDRIPVKSVYTVENCDHAQPRVTNSRERDSGIVNFMQTSHLKTF